MASGPRVDDDSWRAAETAMSARDKQMHRIRDVVAEIEKGERALMGEDSLLGPHGHPLLPHLVLLIARETAKPVQAAAHPVEAFPARVMVQELAADPVLAGLTHGEVAVLLVRLALQSANIWSGLIMH